MTLFGRLRHWFTPHTTNNFRAKLLHNSSIFSLIALVIVGNIFVRLTATPSLNVLGFTSSVTVDEVLRSTNAIRASAGLSPLSYSEKLADAARRKAANMFSEDYWAHVSPSGKTPWVWFAAAGYSYLYAGENLAKDFGNTSRLMDAWMASPTHKENIVSPKYTEIGLAVVPGSLVGQDTVLVVQLFGKPAVGAVAKGASATTATPAPAVVAEVKTQQVESLAPTSPPPVVSPPKYNTFDLARTMNLVTTALFMLTLIIDLYIARTQRLARRVGSNWAHIIFINLILLATTIVNAGKIL